MSRVSLLGTAGAALALLWGTGCEAVHGVDDGGPGELDSAPGSADAAPEADAAPQSGMVSVTVYDQFDFPVQGALVLFYGPAGAEIDRVRTGGDGRASALVPPRSSITVASTTYDDFGIYHGVMTLIGVMPGDAIEVGPREPDYGGDPMGQLLVSFPNEVAGSSQFQLRIGCNAWGFGLGEYTLDLYEDKCNAGLEPVDLIATVTDAANEPIAFDLRLGVPLDSGNYVVFNNFNANFYTLMIDAHNPPDEMVMARPSLGVMRRGLDYALTEPEGAALAPGDGAQFALRYPADLGQSLHPALTGLYGAGGDPSNIDGFAFVSRALGPTPPAFEVDLAAETLPRVTDVSAAVGTDDDFLDMAIQGDSSSATAIGAGLEWRQPGGDREIQWRWDIIAATDLGPPLTLPRLPTDVVVDPFTSSHAWPPGDAAIQTSLAAGVLQVPLDDWALFRQSRPFDFFENPLPANAPTGATVRFTVGGLFNL